MAFRFETVGQEINVWYTLNRGYNWDGPNKKFFEEMASKKSVELNEGMATLVTSHNVNGYEGDSWIVFEYKGKMWRMDIDEYDSWDEGDEPNEPYEVVAKPVNEVQYVRP